jgi:hypothetical protein
VVNNFRTGTCRKFAWGGRQGWALLFAQTLCRTERYLNVTVFNNLRTGTPAALVSVRWVANPCLNKAHSGVVLKMKAEYNLKLLNDWWKEVE